MSQKQGADPKRANKKPHVLPQNSPVLLQLVLIVKRFYHLNTVFFANDVQNLTCSLGNLNPVDSAYGKHKVCNMDLGYYSCTTMWMFKINWNINKKVFIIIINLFCPNSLYITQFFFKLSNLFRPEILWVRHSIDKFTISFQNVLNGNVTTNIFTVSSLCLSLRGKFSNTVAWKLEK